MSRRSLAVAVCLLAVAAVVAGWLLCRGASVPRDYAEAGRAPRIDPDYRGCTIPPNIAPLNFVVEEPGAEYRVSVSAGQEVGFVVAGRTPAVVLPPERWQGLLERNRGNALHLDVYVRGQDGRWCGFDRITNRIAPEAIDSYLVYRRLKPVHNVYTNMGTYQRHVGTFRETPVLRSGPASLRCVNCHTFVNNDPETMCLHIRGKDGAAMILARGGTTAKIDTRTQLNRAPAAYTAWHPSGRLAVFSSIEIVQFHHAVGESRDVFVHASDLALYRVDTRRVTSAPQIADPDHLETFPAWSPDGKYLYFSSAKRVWPEGLKDRNVLPLSFRKARYDLMRIGYDVATGTWGTLEPVLLADDLDASLNEPRVSPDGRFLLFCASEYGCFPVFQRSSDLHMLELASGRHWQLEINSPRSDSWHCWSANSRWIAFASKRRDGLFGRVYFSYVAPDGKVHKPVLLPQEDPTFYDRFLDNFNAPELITGPIRVAEEDWLQAIRSPRPQRAVSAGMDPGRNAAPALPAEPPAPQPAAAQPADPAEAGRCYQRGLAAEQRGRIDEAVEHYRRSVELLPKLYPANIQVAGRLARIYATNPSDRIRNGQEAVVLAVRAYKNVLALAERGRDEAMRRGAQAELPVALDTLAAAYAESGGYQKAVDTALQAETAALHQGRVELAVQIRDRIESYLLDRPYRAPTGQ
ncbi:MAG: PD40 domain-containing protein [Pirellulales bacterium]|nr:PD40 domain-containing protein [Pirellulales bacterium]